MILEGDPFEVTTFRFDGPYSDGRHPNHIRYGTLEEDVIRRDFTINAMALKQISKDKFRLTDPFNGQKDLKNKLISNGVDQSKLRVVF